MANPAGGRPARAQTKGRPRWRGGARVSTASQPYTDALTALVQVQTDTDGFSSRTNG